MANIGYSPDQLEDLVRQLGGLDSATVGVQGARLGEITAPPILTAHTPEDRAALDRYTNFAQLSSQANNPIERGINYAGGMGAMGITELAKLLKANKGLSYLWNRLKGTPSGAQFFGGKDVSQPSLANLAAAHYGFMRGNRK